MPKIKWRPKQRTTNRLFLPDYLTEVKAVAMRGGTDREMALTFGISPTLFKKWKKQYPSFREAIEKGRTRADAAVVEALFKRATGKFSIPHTEVIKYKDSYETLHMRKHFPPDFPSIQYWLNNRKKEHWQQRNSSEVSGPNGKPIELTAGKGELIDALLDLVKPKADGDSSSPVDSDGHTKAKSPGLKQKRAKKKAR